MGAVAAVGSLVAGGIGAAGKYQAGMEAADASLAVAQFNSGMFLRRAAQADINAAHSTYLANFTKAQAFYEADVTRKLGDVEWNWSKQTQERQREAAGMAADYTRQRGEAEAAIIESESARLGEFGGQNRARMAKENRAAEGAVRAAAAASGQELGTGSTLELEIEQAETDQLRLLDDFIAQQTQQIGLQYRAQLARADSTFEADATEYQAELQIADEAFRADVSKYLTRFKAAATETQGWINWANYKTQAANFKNEAFDDRMQAQFALYEGEAAAAAAKTSAFAGLFSDVAALGSSTYTYNRQGAFRF